MFKAKLIFILTILVLSGIAARGQEKTVRNALRMEISTARKCYAPLEWFPVTIKLINRGRRSVYIENDPWGLGVTPYDDQGRLIGISDPIRPPYRGYVLPATTFKRIGPGRHVTFNESVQVGKGVSYTLIGYYRSVVFGNNVPNELSAYKVRGFNDPDVQSPSLDITVSSKCKG